MNEELKIIISAEIDNLKKNTKEAQEQVKETADKGESGFKKFGEAAKKAGKVVGTGLKAAGAAIAAAATALVALGESTKEYRIAQAKLATAFETAGGSAETAKQTYNELYRVLGEDDVAVEAANHLAKMTTNQKELSEWTNICQGVYATFGDSLPIEGLTEAANETAKVGQLTGSLADALNWAGISEDDFNAKLAACNDEAEREQLIRETLTGLYDEAAATYEKNAAAILAENEAQAKLTDALSKLGAVAIPIMTTLKTIAADILNKIAPFVELIGNGLQGALNGSAEAGTLFAEGLNGILDTVINLVNNALPQVLQLITDLIPLLIETLAAQLPNILQAIIDGVIQIINALTEMLPRIVSAIMEVVPKLINQLIGAIPQILQAAIQLLMAIVDAIPTIVIGLINALPSIIETIINALLEAIPMVIDASITLLMKIVEAIPTILDALIENLPKIINTIIDGILDGLPMLLEGAIQLLMAIIQAIPTIISVLVEKIPQIVSTIINTLLKRLPDLIQGAVKLFMGIIKAIPQIIAEIVKNMPKIIKSIVSGLSKGIGDVANVGKNLVKGLWNGISNMVSWIGEKIRGFGESVLNGLKSFFGIHSPSRLMKDKVGKYLALGIGEGFVSEMGAVNKEIQDSMKPLTAARNFSISGEIEAPVAIKANSGSLASLENNNGWFTKLASTLNGNDSKQIILQVDGKTFAQASINSINQLTKQTGSLPLILA